MEQLRPESQAELARLVGDRAGRNQALAPRGGGTLSHLGYPLSRDAAELDLRSLDRLIDYPARDLTVTVEAGMTVARLQGILAQENQRLAVDVPRPEAATVGGSIAANVSGPRRLRSGTWRDAVIGLTVATDTGELASAGGRVVKNVAGYDLMKLHTGALGTLGVITQVTLKVTPRPEDRAMLALPVAGGDLAGVLDRLHASSSRPAIVELLSPAVARRHLPTPESADWVLLIGFEEKATTVRWQVQTLVGELPDCRPVESSEVWAALAELHPADAADWVMQLSVPPSRVADCANRLAARGHSVVAEALTGTLTAYHSDDVDLDAIRPDPPGRVSVLKAPAGRHPVRFSVSDAELRLMRSLKAALDPRDVFNPGRLFHSP